MKNRADLSKSGYPRSIWSASRRYPAFFWAGVRHKLEHQYRRLSGNGTVGTTGLGFGKHWCWEAKRRIWATIFDFRFGPRFGALRRRSPVR